MSAEQYAEVQKERNGDYADAPHEVGMLTGLGKEPVQLASEMVGREFVELRENLIPLKRDPSPRCKRCFGRGFAGRDSVTRKFIVCPCTQ